MQCAVVAVQCANQAVVSKLTERSESLLVMWQLLILLLIQTKMPIVSRPAQTLHGAQNTHSAALLVAYVEGLHMTSQCALAGGN